MQAQERALSESLRRAHPGEQATVRGREMGERPWLVSCIGSPPVGSFPCNRPKCGYNVNEIIVTIIIVIIIIIIKPVKNSTAFLG